MKKIRRGPTWLEENQRRQCLSFCSQFNKYALPILSIFGYKSSSDLLRWGRSGMDFKELLAQIDKAPAFKGMDPKLATSIADRAVREGCDTSIIRTRIPDPDKDREIKTLIERLRLPAGLKRPEFLKVINGKLEFDETAWTETLTTTVSADSTLLLRSAQELANVANEWSDDFPGLDLSKIFVRGPKGDWQVDIKKAFG